MRHCDNRVLVLADDFTGANDAGVCLAEVGMRVEVAFDARQQSSAQALILNSDSRALSPANAVQRIECLLQDAMTERYPRWVVKKLDSTLRGNVGSELEAAMRTLGCPVAVLAPAFPAAGRVTRGGKCYVNGVPLTDTEFASDPKTPVQQADIAELIGLQSAMKCENVTVETLPQTLAMGDETFRVLIVDAQTDDDLDAIIATVAQSKTRLLLAGSAGICEALARQIQRSAPGPLLAVVGSMSEIAQRQITALSAHPRIQHVEIDIQHAFTGEIAIDAQAIATAIRQGNHCVVSTPSDAQARASIDAQCLRHGLPRAQLGEQICRHLAQLVELALDRCQPGALYLSGGDVAIAVATRLQATGFHITGRVAQCVPYGFFLGSRWQRPVMTKAGGFGSATTLYEVVDFIEEKMSD